MTNVRSEQIESVLSGLTFSSESWNTPTLLNSWVQYGSGFESCQYFKDPNGFVHIKGLIKSGTAGDNIKVFTLPEGYRPSSVLIFPAIHYNGVVCQTRIESDGDVNIYTSSATWYSFGFISFKAEQ